jgi:hypothetical protein
LQCIGPFSLLICFRCFKSHFVARFTFSFWSSRRPFLGAYFSSYYFVSQKMFFCKHRRQNICLNCPVHHCESEMACLWTSSHFWATLALGLYWQTRLGGRRLTAFLITQLLYPVLFSGFSLNKLWCQLILNVTQLFQGLQSAAAVKDDRSPVILVRSPVL